jgi:hypothetical protein
MIGMPGNNNYSNNKENTSKINRRFTERRERQRSWTLSSLLKSKTITDGAGVGKEQTTELPTIKPLAGGLGTNTYVDVLPPPPRSRSSLEGPVDEDNTTTTTTTTNNTALIRQHGIKDDGTIVAVFGSDDRLQSDSSFPIDEKKNSDRIAANGGVVVGVGMSLQLHQPPGFLDATNQSIPISNNNHNNVSNSNHNDMQFSNQSQSLPTKTSTSTFTTTMTNTATSRKSTKSVRNDNFVRLNLKNNAGACRGARNNKKQSSRRGTGGRGLYHYGDNDDNNNNNGGYVTNTTTSSIGVGGFTGDTTMFGTSLTSANWKPTHGVEHNTHDNNYSHDDRDEVITGDAPWKRHRRRGWGGKQDRNDTTTTSGGGDGLNTASAGTGGMYISKSTGLDPLDEFVDGNFHLIPTTTSTSTATATRPGSSTKSSQSTTTTTTPTIATTATTSSRCTVDTPLLEEKVPNCARHQRPCKLVVVKKNNTGNKGRKFYACCMPRGEQCNHFQWADDTVEVWFYGVHTYMTLFLPSFVRFEPCADGSITMDVFMLVPYIESLQGCLYL